MNIAVNRKTIIERCGEISYKRGEAFCQKQQVEFRQYSSNACEATVSNEFEVSIRRLKNDFQATCSCPKLASYQKECQHVAAVLLAVMEHQRNGTEPEIGREDLSRGFLTLFHDRPARSMTHQLHFEDRSLLDVTIICEADERKRLNVGLQIGDDAVPDMKQFLQSVQNGQESAFYNPAVHCFQKETADLLEQLIKIKDNATEIGEVLFIPPAFWDALIPLLRQAPSVKLIYHGCVYDGFAVSDGPLPLHFVFNEHQQLHVKGLDEIAVLPSYHAVFADGKLIALKKEDSKRLADLQQMMQSSGTNYISIAKEQLPFFLERVVPGLKRLGECTFLGEQFVKTPLIAKLYLDRIRNRLLAGIEFQYEHVVINPLEEGRTPPLLIRDKDKEAVILDLMEESDFAKTDGGYFLQNEELEYRFLYHVLPKLQKLMQVYATTAIRNRIFRENPKPKIRVKVKKERTNWLEFKFEMDSIPEKHIKDVLQALEEKRKYYRLHDGTLLSLESREFEEIQRFLNAVPVQEEDIEAGFEVPFVQGLRLMDVVDDKDTFELEQSFRTFLDSIEHPDKLDIPVPEQLEPILRDYQIHGYKWLKTLARYSFGGILADDMGLGKTLQSITYIVSELEDVRIRQQPVLIVCPSSLTYNWRSEMRKFAPELKVSIIDGNKAERNAKFKQLAETDVIITSYPLLRRDIKWYEKQTFHTVFFDEAQAFKNPVTQTAKAVKMVQAERRFALTGTPIENSLEELWSIFYVIFPELFLGLKAFSQLRREQVARRVRPFLLRRVKEDVLSELPEKVESVESSDLLPEQKKLYGAYLAKLRHDTLKHLDKDTFRKNRIRILAGLTRLRQICCHPGLFVDNYDGGSAKFEQLLQILEESRHAGRRVLIFSQFTSMLALIGRALANEGRSYLYLDGQTPSEERVQLCDRFNRGEGDVFLISLKAGGTGLNLTGADTVILYDIWWNPAVEEQAMDRAHRMGQNNVVQVIKLVARGTIEEKMNELQEKKRQLIEEIIEPGERTSKLTEEDIREILMI
ncbi:MAG: SNF2 helicase associated domain-containing protein [Bacillus sp. (in: firmicutes)]